MLYEFEYVWRSDTHEYDFLDLVPDLPRSIRSVLSTCTNVQLKFISSGVYCHLGLKTNLLGYVERQLCTIDFDNLSLYINVDGLFMSKILIILQFVRITDGQVSEVDG